MWRLARNLWRSDRAAVAPLTAMSLFALIAVGGVAFDYARLAAMDTELQQAADQAALAAATQLDHADGAQARAATAIQDGDNTHRLSHNLTRFSNDNNGTTVEIASITFCSDFDDSVADTTTACTEADGDSDSKFVIVTTELRTANYAFTPIVAAFSGTSQASAVASVQSSICSVSPLMVCAPPDNLDWPTDTDIGKGLRLKPMPQNTWAPGNYGLLDFGNGNTGAVNAFLGHGLNGCQAEGDVNTLPGNKEVTDAINTRLDVYLDHQSDPAVCVADGTGCPAPNTGKDMYRTETYTIDTAPTALEPAAPSCGQPVGGTTAYSGTLDVSPWTQSNAVKSFSRDSCHLTNSCVYGTNTDSNFGNGTWDFSGYMAANYPSIAADDRASTVGGTTRFAVYNWELLVNSRLDPRTMSAPPPATQLKKIRGVDRKIWTFTKQCNFKRPVQAPQTYDTQKDRRLFSVIAADCAGLHGTGTAGVDFKLLRVFDVFLTEPSLDRGPANARITDNKEIYGEIVGPAAPLASESGFQYYSRIKPFLVR